MIDLNSWYQENPDRVEFEMAQSAARELFDAVQENYYGFNAITILATAAETLSIVFGLMTSRNKSIKCESFMTCCRLNLNGKRTN